MVHLSTFVLALATTSALAAPVKLNKRIAQVISASTTKWEQACTAAGGAQQCNPISVAAFSTLLAAPGPCEQQNAADKMIDLAKTLKNDANMIKLAQIFAQQPRNTPTSLSTPYCQQPPKNAELNGLFQCQFQGANPKTFVGGLAVGAPGTVPLGKSGPLSPAGSCPANPGGPIADGTQLVDQAQNPGATGGAAAGNAAAAPAGNGNKAAGTKENSAQVATSSADDDEVEDCSGEGASNNAGSGAPPAAPAPAAAAASESSGAGNFQVKNAQDAQVLNATFATMTADSPCTDGDEACVAGGFAQCVGGKFVITQCAGGLVCEALPLVKKPGTSITCTTTADAQQRIKDAGATGGITGA